MMDEKQGLFNSPHIGGRRMSSSLKERLKRSARSKMSPLGETATSPCTTSSQQQMFTSPCTPRLPESFTSPCASARAQSFILSENPSVTSPSPTLSPIESPISVLRVMKTVNFDGACAKTLTPCLASIESIEDSNERKVLKELHSSLKKKIVKNEEKLHKLQLVQKHHNKNKPDDLQKLIKKWLRTSQEALRKLYEVLPEPKMEFPQLISSLNIDKSLIKYNPEEDTFYGT